MTLAEQFGRGLFKARRHMGVTQEALGAMCGLSRSTVYLLESGKRAPELATLVKLADALGVDPAELVLGLRP